MAALLALLVPLCVTSATIAASPSMEPCQGMEPGKAGSIEHVVLWNLLAGFPCVRAPQLDPPEARDHRPLFEQSPRVPERFLTPAPGRAPPLA